MPDEVKQKKVTFATSLPMGERGTFTHDGSLWIAYRANKNQAINALLDRLIGLHRCISNEMLRWINERPQDGELIARVLTMTQRAEALRTELIEEKAKVLTS